MAGVTYDGLRLGAEQVGRLIALLASLSLLHHSFGTTGLLSGMHRLLSPFTWRDVTIVRLMLVLDYVEQRRGETWRSWLSPAMSENEFAPGRLMLTVYSYRWTDGLLAFAVFGILVVVAIWT
jgi:hypothetical protein